jgi:acetylornithine deacetylase/succinyl-diaminopimelate desuccinylase-like protein
MDKESVNKTIEKYWQDWWVKGLGDFVRVPNLTPMVDDKYLENGLLEQAMDLVDNYINKLEIKGLSRKIFKTEKGLPLITYIVEPSEGVTRNVMVYGHIDKQPYGEGWDTDPKDPVIKGDCMYGRGSADDGYSAFSCMLAVKVGQELGVKMPRICLVLETEEESGSASLIPLLNQAKDVIGTPDVCLCMDSGAFDYNKLWVTSSLRGICILDLTVQVGKAGYHSGEVGGIVPETFRIVRQLLDRLDDSKTGEPCDELKIEVPEWKRKEAEEITAIAGKELYEKYAVEEGAQYCH